MENGKRRTDEAANNVSRELFVSADEGNEASEQMLRLDEEEQDNDEPPPGQNEEA